MQQCSHLFVTNFPPSLFSEEPRIPIPPHQTNKGLQHGAVQFSQLLRVNLIMVSIIVDEVSMDIQFWEREIFAARQHENVTSINTRSDKMMEVFFFLLYQLDEGLLLFCVASLTDSRKSTVTTPLPHCCLS